MDVPVSMAASISLPMFTDCPFTVKSIRSSGVIVSRVREYKIELAGDVQGPEGRVRSIDDRLKLNVAFVEATIRSTERERSSGGVLRQVRSLAQMSCEIKAHLRSLELACVDKTLPER